MTVTRIETEKDAYTCADCFGTFSNLQLYVVQVASVSVLQPAFQHPYIAKIAIKTLQVVCDSPKGFVSIFVV